MRPIFSPSQIPPSEWLILRTPRIPGHSTGHPSLHPPLSILSPAFFHQIPPSRNFSPRPLFHWSRTYSMAKAACYSPTASPTRARLTQCKVALKRPLLVFYPARWMSFSIVSTVFMATAGYVCVLNDEKLVSNHSHSTGQFDSMASSLQMTPTPTCLKYRVNQPLRKSSKVSTKPLRPSLTPTQPRSPLTVTMNTRSGSPTQRCTTKRCMPPSPMPRESPRSKPTRLDQVPAPCCSRAKPCLCGPRPQLTTLTPRLTGSMWQASDSSGSTMHRRRKRW